MVTHTSFHFQAASELAVVGQNPEFADLGNPDGHIIGEVWFILATDPQGNRCRSEALAKTDAVARAARLNELSDAGVAMVLCFWDDFFPEYGSEAYSAADEIAWERKLELDAEERLFVA